MSRDFLPSDNQQEDPMTKMIFVSRPVTAIQAAIAIHEAPGFEQNGNRLMIGGR